MTSSADGKVCKRRNGFEGKKIKLEEKKNEEQKKNKDKELSEQGQ